MFISLANLKCTKRTTFATHREEPENLTQQDPFIELEQ